MTFQRYWRKPLSVSRSEIVCPRKMGLINPFRTAVLFNPFRAKNTWNYSLFVPKTGLRFGKGQPRTCIYIYFYRTTTALATCLIATVVPCTRAVCYSAPTCSRLAAQHSIGSVSPEHFLLGGAGSRY